MVRSRLSVLWPLLVVACGGAPAATMAPVVALPVASAAPAPAPSLPPEPTGLVELSAPPKVCELTGLIGDEGVVLGAPQANLEIGRLARVPVTLTFGEGLTFAEARSPSWVLRGVVMSTDLRVRPARWLSFGGVVFAGARDRLVVRSVHDNKLFVAAPETTGFTLSDGVSAEATCQDVSLAFDPDGILHGSLPPAFAAVGQARPMMLSLKKDVPVSAQVKGVVAGAIDQAPDPLEVTLLERQGSRARIRWGHVAGWIDAALLSPLKPMTGKQAALRDAMRFGMFGLLTGGPYSSLDAEPRAVASPDTTPVVCSSDVRLVLGGTGGSPEAAATGPRFVVGRIPAGQPVRVVRPGAELTEVFVDGALLESLTVPSRDIASGCVAAPRTSAPVPAPAPDQDPGPADAIDALDGVIPGAPVDPQTTLPGVGGLRSPTAHALAPMPQLRAGAMQVNGRLPPEVIQRIVRQNFGRFRLCYENGLRSRPTLTGRVVVRFIIDDQGNIKNPTDGGSDLPSTETIGCIVRAFANLSFPQPESGIVTVVFPITLSPAHANP